jgi:hypothetical protein
VLPAPPRGLTRRIAQMLVSSAGRAVSSRPHGSGPWKSASCVRSAGRRHPPSSYGRLFDSAGADHRNRLGAAGIRPSSGGTQSNEEDRLSLRAIAKCVFVAGALALAPAAAAAADDGDVGVRDGLSYQEAQSSQWSIAANDPETRADVGVSGGTTEIGWELLCSGEYCNPPFESRASSASQAAGSKVATRAATSSDGGEVDMGVRSGCGHVWAQRNAYTALGALAWRWYHYKYFCWRRGEIHYVSTTAHPKNMAGFFYFRGIVGSQNTYYNSSGSNSRSGHYSFRQAAIENCVLKYGCISMRYPWVKLWARAGGTFRWQTGQ